MEPIGAPAAPGGAGHPEQEALRQLRDLLDTWPARPPSPEAVAAVEARAAVVAAAVTQTDAALGRAFAARPQPRPSDDAVAAVLARAAEVVGAEPVALSAESPVEAAVLDQSLQALDRLRSVRPDASVIAAVEARAAEASTALAAVRSLYLDAPAIASVEAEALRQSRAAVERAFAARPQPRPSAEAVDAVLARAAEAAGVEAEPTDTVAPVEAAVLAQSLRALDRLPRPRPAAATLDAVRLAAATVGAAPVRNDRPAPSVDRAPARPPRRRTPVGIWAGAAGLLVAALAAIVLLPLGGAESEAPMALATAEATEAPVSPLDASGSTPVEEPAADLDATAPAGSGGALAVVSPIAGLAAPPPVSAGRPSTAAESAPQRGAQPLAATSLQPVAATSRPAASTAPSDPPSWEMSQDVRALSLRLQELGSEDDLAWDDVPAEAFGQPASPSAGSAPGLQSVRAGTPAIRTAPARARLRTDSSSVQR
ncbi:hypothetical protein BSZ37_07040 [Rubrivirga marina]|uniref:Uncharacterized protein n=1 Tax=Rubrivirga marina TaxID=1196024 RepID=A0A271IZT0_9BACT|nr:hypothetical protein BSZ37_07040 [Rubrivirga marina]